MTTLCAVSTKSYEFSSSQWGWLWKSQWGWLWKYE